MDGLRLVHPPRTSPTGPAQPTERSAAAAPAKSTPVDRFHFESVYEQQLPRIEVTDAHRRVEQIRSELVAGRTQVPIHFEQSPSQPGPAAPNPYANPYAAMKLTPAPAEVNARASESGGPPPG